MSAEEPTAPEEPQEEEDASVVDGGKKDAGRDAAKDAGRPDTYRCTPDCAGKTCGNDGCGGSCGSCGASQTCVKDQCVADTYCMTWDVYQADAYCAAGCCPGAPRHQYEWGGQGGRGGNRYYCACTSTCLSPSNSAWKPLCGKDADCCAGSHCDIDLTPGSSMYGLGFCNPDPGTSCSGQACTASRGGGGCCQWTPNCWGSQGCKAGKAQANDPCADNEACDTGLTCVAGHCRAPCTPSCTGKQCGSDGCGGSCGTCGPSMTCSANQCVPVCVPSCAGKQCGSDGCGGSCGTCGAGRTCSSGTCVGAGCDPVSNTGCASPNECILLSSGQTTCALAGTGTRGSFCNATTTCAGGYACFSNVCRKICDLSSGTGCIGSESCTGVTGWATYGACR